MSVRSFLTFMSIDPRVPQVTNKRWSLLSKFDASLHNIVTIQVIIKSIHCVQKYSAHNHN